MSLSAQDLGEAVRKLGELQKHMPNQPKDVYDFGKFLATSLTENRPPLQPIDVNMAVISAEGAFDHANGRYFAVGKKTDDNTKYVAIARVVFPQSFADELERYYTWLDEHVNKPKIPPH